MKCTKCGRENKPGTTYCIFCGEELPTESADLSPTVSSGSSWNGKSAMIFTAPQDLDESSDHGKSSSGSETGRYSEDGFAGSKIEDNSSTSGSFRGGLVRERKDVYEGNRDFADKGSYSGNGPSSGERFYGGDGNSSAAQIHEDSGNVSGFRANNRRNGNAYAPQGYGNNVEVAKNASYGADDYAKDSKNHTRKGSYCQKCGAFLDEGAKFCHICGEVNTGSSGGEAKSQKRERPASETIGGTAGCVSEGSTAPKINIYNVDNGSPQDFGPKGERLPEKYRPISPWGYLGYTLLFAIPIAGFIIAIVFAVDSGKNVNVRNYARYQFIPLIIALIIILIVALAGGAMLGGMRIRY